jgi:WD40 repeat protein
MLIADPHSIIAGGGDGSLKLWRFAGDKVSSIFVGAHSSSISALYRLDKNSFLSADSEGILRRWNDPSRVISASFLHATVTSPTLIFLESGDLVLGDGEAGKLKLWRRDGSVHDSIYIGSHGVTSLLEIRKNEILIGDKSGGIVAYKPTSRRGLNILPLPKKHRGQVDIMLKTGGNTFISVDSRTLFHWRYSHGGHSPRVASSLALPCKAGVNDVVLHRRSDILLLCFEGDIFSMHGGKAVRAMQLPPHKTGFRAIRLLSLPNGDLITTYQNGESQIWRSGSPLKSSFKIVGSGPRTRSPYLGIGPGRMMGGLDKANLALMSYQDWVSSVSGPLAPDEANLVRRWSTNFPVDTGQWLFVSSPVSVVTESDDTGYIANITASRRGELAVYLSGHQNKAKDGIVFLSLHSVVRSACGAVELGSLERRPELRGVAESAMTSCGLVLR